MRYVVERRLADGQRGYRSFGDLASAEKDWRAAPTESNVKRCLLFSVQTTDARQSIDLVKSGRARVVHDTDPPT